MPTSRQNTKLMKTGSHKRITDTRYLATTIQKGLDVLALFKDRSDLTFTDIQAALGLHKSTLFRILHTLEINGYLARDEDGKYALGMNIFILGNSFSRESHIRRVATPYLQELSRQVSMTVQVGILEGTSVVILQKIDPPDSIRMFSRVGAMVPAHCTGQGKTLLAFSPRETVERVINTHGLQRFTANTFTTPNTLFEELAAIRTRGYAIDNSEHERHIKCVAVPVLNGQGMVEAALSMTGLVLDFPDQQSVETHARQLLAVAERIRKDLGFN
jgi:IclR family transcriptional regulator, acetate operon repressor